MADCGAVASLVRSVAPTSGAGAITACDKTGRGTILLRSTSGGGATTEDGNPACLSSDTWVAVTAGGIRGSGCAQATIFGRGVSRFNSSAGGLTMVCRRFSEFGGTEMMACGPLAGSPFSAGALLWTPVSSVGRYSDNS